jgi:hypothetical protein
MMRQTECGQNARLLIFNTHFTAQNDLRAALNFKIMSGSRTAESGTAISAQTAILSSFVHSCLQKRNCLCRFNVRTVHC